VLLFLLAQSLDLLETVDELPLHVGHHFPQTLDFICAAIQHVLQISKQFLFIIYEFFKFCDDKQVSDHGVIDCGYNFENQIQRTLMVFPLLLESALELGDGLLEADPLLHQLVDTPGGLLQLHCPLISFLAHILHVLGCQEQTT
jgi:hypothetical protein